MFVPPGSKLTMIGVVDSESNSTVMRNGALRQNMAGAGAPAGWEQAVEDQRKRSRRVISPLFSSVSSAALTWATVTWPLRETAQPLFSSLTTSRL